MEMSAKMLASLEATKQMLSQLHPGELDAIIEKVNNYSFEDEQIEDCLE